ncbi:DUF6884 domain-containing protein [Halomicrobium urmianum]|uniref:DUF6884 domain-containing protein n=1 Tax=Halomicrobium urmianum TaxID=1586233 RepID=UPI001CDA4B1A|nr:DUF6884 domain-containing protein [Halomicrobium urmianum]
MTADGYREIGLVCCAKAKRDEAALPKDLYVSDYFQKMRTYAEQEHDEWWILSAKHGLLDPSDNPIEPYDKTLTTAPKSERRDWADAVAADLQETGLLAPDARLVLHAGKTYYGELLPLLTDSDVGDVIIPTEGMRIGETLSWYNDRL